VGFATALELAIEMGESDFTARIADAMSHLPASFKALGTVAPDTPVTAEATAPPVEAPVS
jgi:hypothetical protein